LTELQIQTFRSPSENNRNDALIGVETGLPDLSWHNKQNGKNAPKLQYNTKRP
jgi:hypothetical protein